MSERRLHFVSAAAALFGVALFVVSFFPAVRGQEPLLFALAVAAQVAAAVITIQGRSTPSSDEASPTETIDPEEVAALRRTAAEAEEQIQAKSAEVERFTYIVSHDLRSPLLTIQGFSDILKMDMEEGKAEAVEEDLEHILQATQRMRLLLDDLLELSRIGRFTEPAVEVPLAEVVADALYEVRELVEEKGAEVEVADDLPTLKVERPRIQQLYRALLDNAVRYGEEGRPPRVKVGRRENGELFVSDDGTGLQPEQLEKAFGPFERFSTESVGSGMGLAHARRIVEHHRGAIRAESEGSGKGTTVVFTLSEPPESE